MGTTKMLGVALLFLAWTIIYPVSRADAYFAEDSFASFWEQDVKAQNPVPAGQADKARVSSGQSDALEVTHRVAPGETLWSLARYYHVELARLMSVNKISDPTLLSVGRVLVIPGARRAEWGPGAASGAPEAVQAVARGWDGNLGWPLLGELTQQFGPRENGGFHHGLDIAGNTGIPVRAAQRGVVAYSGWLPFYGYTLMIDHGSGFRTLYGHLHDFTVRTGAMVAKDQVIAHVGSTGNATGPHLHFELRRSNQAVNPLPYLSN